MYSPSTNEDKTPQASSRRTWTQQQTLSVHVVFYIQSEMDDKELSSRVKKKTTTKYIYLDALRSMLFISLPGVRYK